MAATTTTTNTTTKNNYNNNYYNTYVADDGDQCKDVENVVPSADVLSLQCWCALVELDELVGVKTQLDDVIDQSTQRRQRKRRHEDCHETELDHYNIKRQQQLSCTTTTLCLKKTLRRF